MKRALLAAVLLLIAGALWLMRAREEPPPAPPVAAALPAPPEVAAATLAHLRRGVNISGWLQHGYENDPPRYAPDAGDWQLIHALGLGHARLLMDPATLLNDRGLPKAEALARLRQAVDGAVKEGLLVIATLQLPEEMKASLAQAPQREALAGTWRALASALRDIPPDQLVLEPLNEPGFDDPRASRALMQELVAALRSVVPKHTLLVSGHKYSGVDELVAMQPLSDHNLIYGFHFYQPFDFTHQGADWGDPVWATLRGFPYPSSPELVAPLLDSQPASLRDRLHWYGEERWNRERIGKTLGEAMAWGKRHDVNVLCSEFGALRKRSAPADRAAWLRDVRETLEAGGAGWTTWDYSGPFGIVSGPQGKRVVDAAAVEALGLNAGLPAKP